MTLHASVSLSQVFICLASNPGGFSLSCGSSGSAGGGGQRSDTFTQEGAFRSYANGVTRLILGSASTRVIAVTLRALTPGQVNALEAMVGQTCLFRDSYGRRIFGSFIITTATDIPLSGRAQIDLQTDVTIAFQQVTYSEAV